MSISTEDAAEFDVITDEASIRLAAERIRGANCRAEATPGGRAGDQWSGPERRREHRGQLTLGALLLPVQVESGRARAISPDQPQRPVLTLNISPQGIAFRHDSPLPVKHGILEFDLSTEGRVELLVEQRWTRRYLGSAFGYQSGCKIVGVAHRSGGAESE
jgi:hypothetical protein